MPDKELGDLPAAARERLADSEPSAGHGLFTSDLSVSEFLLVRQAGYAPLGLVMGTSIYHIGTQVSAGGSRELTKLTQALYDARELAMHRMEEEAAALHADGIVGVRLDIRFYQWARHLGEFIAIGTAVRGPKDDGATRTGRPFTSDLSGQAFWTLLQAGYAPVGLVLGNCVYHVARRGVVTATQGALRNQELLGYTEAFYTARELALERMQKEADQLDAEGIVEVKLNEHEHGWGGHTLEFTAIGTAVRPLPGAGPPPEPTLVLGLDE